MMTYARYAKDLARSLAAMGRENSEREAVWLTEALAGGDFIRIREQIVSEEVLSRAAGLLERLCAGEPFQYVLGTQDFYGLTLFSDARALIPRPETEVLTEKAISLTPPGGKVLDLCCGSGCIAVAMACHLPGREIWAADISPAALSLAQENARQHHAEIHFCCGDLFEALPADAAPFDLIIANPPYVSRPLLAHLDCQIAFEPQNALDGGGDGLDFYRRIVPAAPAYLKPWGLLLLEAGEEQGEAILALSGNGSYRGGFLFPDLCGKKRFFCGQAI